MRDDETRSHEAAKTTKKKEFGMNKKSFWLMVAVGFVSTLWAGCDGPYFDDVHKPVLRAVQTQPQSQPADTK